MRDTELDELLAKWNAPTAPASLRDKVRSGFASAAPQADPPLVPARSRWTFASGARRALPAAAMVGIGAFLWMVTQALSQTAPPVRIPYTVDSEFLRYGDDGAPTVEMYSTSYTAPHGAEIVLSRSLPGRPFETAVGRTLDAALPLWQRMILPFAVSPKEMETYRKRQSGFRQIIVFFGCSDWSCLTTQHWGFRRPAAGGDNACLEGPVVGRETILNYPTETFERSWENRGRMTLWLAPDLGCFALRVTAEEGPRPDGTYHLLQTKQALKVTMNP